MEVLEPRKHLGFSPLGSTNGILTGNNGGWQFTVGMRGGDCTAGETNRCSESTSKPVPGGGPHRAQRAAGLKTWAGSHDGDKINTTYSNNCPSAASRTWKIRKSLLGPKLSTHWSFINIKYSEAQLRQISQIRLILCH